MSDPHIICSQGARNCSNCFSLCTDESPCICCGGEDDAPEWEDIEEEADESPDFLVAEVERLAAEVERLTAELADRDRRIEAAWTAIHELSMDPDEYRSVYGVEATVETALDLLSDALDSEQGGVVECVIVRGES